MKKKIIIILSIVLFIGISLLFIVCDFNHYVYNSKDMECNNEGIILSINTYDGKRDSEFFVKSYGHSWISIENKLDEDINLLDFVIKKNEVVTISVYGIINRSCVTFNFEPHFINSENRYQDRISLSTNITVDDMLKVEKFIKESSGWEVFKNCSYFTIKLWNTIVKDEYKVKEQNLVYTPTRLKKSMHEFNNYTSKMDYKFKPNNTYIYENNTLIEVTL